MSDDDEFRRVHFYGPRDLAVGLYVPRVVSITERYDPNLATTSTVDILELHNVQKYLEHGFLPVSFTQEQRDDAVSRIPQIQGTVARHFSTVDSSNFAATVTGIGHEYHADLLELLGRHKAFERCSGEVALSALEQAGVHLHELLTSKKLVQAYGSEIREMLRSSAQNAEYLVRKYLERDRRSEMHIPSSLTPADARDMLQAYLESDEANPNYVKLIATAKQTRQIGIDAKLKLRAKRRHEEMTSALFKETKGLKTGCEISISEDQTEPALFELDRSDGIVSRYTYSRPWLEATTDYPSVLNNFVHLFEFVDRQAMLVMPSHPEDMGVMERLMGATGKDEYKIGAAFRSTDMRTLLQVRIYMDFLNTKGIDLEDAIAWFFEGCLTDEFQATNFSFAPSGLTTPYLQRVRHLFAELESLANQFALFASDGELDRDLLAMGSEQIRYREIPSLLEGKYIYPADEGEVQAIIYQLFSDQSGLTYINDTLRGDNAATLLLKNEVAYEDFREYQRPAIDFLIDKGILRNTGGRVVLINVEQFKILSALFYGEAASYYHLSQDGRAEADAMVTRGWVTRDSSLLSRAEGDYFNYFLNAVDFSNGPQLRNKYLHGAQAKVDTDDAHFSAYLIALRMIVALTIKINDDFCLAALEPIPAST